MGEREYVEDEIFVVGDKSQASSVMEGPGQHQSGDHHANHSYYEEDREPHHGNRHFSNLRDQMSVRSQRLDSKLFKRAITCGLGLVENNFQQGWGIN
jgi:hypothetical protein